MQETQETRVQFLGLEDLLEEEMATPSGGLAWKIPWTEAAWWATVHRVAESDTTEHMHTHTHTYIPLASCTSLNNFFYYPNILIGPLLVLCHVIKTLLFPESSSNICFTTMT